MVYFAVMIGGGERHNCRENGRDVQDYGRGCPAGVKAEEELSLTDMATSTVVVPRLGIVPRAFPNLVSWLGPRRWHLGVRFPYTFSVILLTHPLDGRT
jgi:hypothetical protein